MQRYPYLSGREVFLPDDQLIVTKTDLKGRITYANQTFLAFCGYTKKQVLGAPHNIVRHPHMPRCVFKLLWDRLGAGEEVFANVVNLAANGDHYWVFPTSLQAAHRLTVLSSGIIQIGAASIATRSRKPSSHSMRIY